MAASLYLRHFSLSRPPFPLTPDSDAFFMGGTRKASVEAVLHVLLAERGILKIVGEAGTGKTTLCRYLGRKLGRKHIVLYTCDPSLAGAQIWYAFADGLDLDVPRDDPDRAAAEVRHRLSELADAGRPVVLLIDEAHAMSVDTLEQIRLLSQRDVGAETFRIVLLGPDELDHALARPGMDALRSRVAHSVRLKPLTLGDVRSYLHFRMRAAGWEGEPVFSTGAVRALARLSDGVPRRLNALADKALLAAALKRRDDVRAADVAAAARDIEPEARSRRDTSWLMLAGAFAAGVAATALLAGMALRLQAPPAQTAFGKTSPQGGAVAKPFTGVATGRVPAPLRPATPQGSLGEAVELSITRAPASELSAPLYRPAQATSR